MTATLNTDTAIEYVTAFLAKAGDVAAENIHTTEAGDDESPAIEVRFTLNGRAECMTVWVECGALYGEW